LGDHDSLRKRDKVNLYVPAARQPRNGKNAWAAVRVRDPSRPKEKTNFALMAKLIRLQTRVGGGFFSSRAWLEVGQRDTRPTVTIRRIHRLPLARPR